MFFIFTYISNQNMASYIFQDLDLSFMGIERIAVGGFCGLTNVSCLMLVGNKLVSPPQLYLLKCCIVKLLLGMNNIGKFSKDFLIGFWRLELLNLDQNGMFQMPDLHWIRHTLQNIRI